MRSLYRRLHSLPSQDPRDPGYRRLRYCRYADDTLLGFAGPKAEAEEIKQRLAQFLRDDLKLELSPGQDADHPRPHPARRGSSATRSPSQQRRRPKAIRPTAHRRSLNGTSSLRVPAAVIKAKCAPYLSRGKPARRNPMINESDYNIVATFGAEYRGIVQYYLLAGDVFRLHRLRWVMETSMLKTLASKHRSTVSKMAARHKAKIETPHGPRTASKPASSATGRKPLVARFGGIPLKRQKNGGPHRPPATGPVYPNKELITRLLGADASSAGERTTSRFTTSGSSPTSPGPASRSPDGRQVMAKIRRKSLVVCGDCHDLIHGQPAAPLTQ